MHMYEQYLYMLPRRGVAAAAVPRARPALFAPLLARLARPPPPSAPRAARPLKMATRARAVAARA